jgi:6-phosphogluconolactonase
VSGAGELLVARDADEQARLAAELMARAIDDAVHERGLARLALSGGTTPMDTYRALADLALPWDRTEWFWVDERAVPDDDERSNHRNVTRALRLVEQRVPEERIHRMQADCDDREAAARRYAAALRASFGVASAVAFDAMVLGIGEDGHTASLFPATPAPFIEDRLVAAVDAQPSKGLEARLTLTAPVLRQARLVLVLCRGVSKRAIVEAARAPGPLADVPARLLQLVGGRVVWVVDRAAAP